MPQALPDLRQLRQAVELYLARAYDGPPPRAVRERLQQIDSTPDNPWSCAAIEHTTVGGKPRLSLRLGNRFYPHMKLSIDRAPDGQSYLFRADTHDRHLTAPAGSREGDMLQKLARDNQQLAQEIEAAWEGHGLPTFKTYLRQDLARRRSGTS